MTYSAGEARATYELDTSRFEQAIDRAIKRYDDLAKAAQAAQQRSSLPAPAVPVPTLPQQQRSQTVAPVDAQAAKAAAERARSIREVERALAQQAQAERAAIRGSQQLADSEIRAARAAGDHGRALQLIDAQLSRTASGTVRYNKLLADQARAQSALKNADLGPALPRTFAGLTPDVAAAATNMLSFGAAIGVAAGAAQSFADAYTFKTQLDATNASIAIQLRGIRDSATVFADAQRYADAYKLTQQETSQTIQASIGILRTSNASVEDTFSVLQRLTVLAPGKSIQDAAFSVRELASGDITSIAEQFNISRKQAYEMRDAITSGADVVQVLSGYLDKAGISMDTLKAQTEGAVGQMRELKRAQEEVQLAQADLAASAGVATGVDIQVSATRGLARLLNGELIPTWDEVTVKARVYEEAYRAAMVRGPFAAQQAGFLAIADSTRVAAEAQDYFAERASAAQNAADAERTRVYQDAVLNLGQALQAGAIDADTYAATVQQLGTAYQAEAAEAHNTTAATDTLSTAQNAGAAAADTATAATNTLITALIDETNKKAAATEQTAQFHAFQTDLANIADAVAAGIVNDAGAAALLANRYGIAADAARILINEQANLAAGEVRLARQRAATTQNAPQGIGFNSPGRTGTSDVDAAVRGIQEAKAAAIQAEKDKAAAAAAAEEARRRQIELTGTAAQRAALAQQELNEAVAEFGPKSAQAIDAETRLKQVRTQSGGGGGRTPRAASAPARTAATQTEAEIDTQQSLQDQLAATNRLLDAGNLTEERRTKLLEQRRRLEAQITDEIRDQQRAALDAQAASIDDAKKRLAEAREIRGLQNQAQNARASDEERTAAQLRLAEIAVEQQQRAADIEDKRRKAGDVALPTAQIQPPPLPQQPIPGVNVPLPLALPDLSKLPALQLPTLQAPPVTVNLSVTLDQNGRVTQQTIDPGAVLRVLATQSVAQNLMGGR